MFFRHAKEPKTASKWAGESLLAHKANESSFAQQNAGTEIRDSNKALRSGRFVFAVVVFTRQIRERSNSLCAFTMQRCFPALKQAPFFFLVCR